MTYKEAKEALEKCEGNIVEALAYLEEENKLKPEREQFKSSTFMKKVKNLFWKLHRIRFTVTKEENTILDIPSTLAILLAIMVFPLAIGLVLLAMITNCKIRIKKNSGEEYAINKNIDHITSTVNNITNKVSEEIKKS